MVIVVLRNQMPNRGISTYRTVFPTLRLSGTLHKLNLDAVVSVSCVRGSPRSGLVEVMMRNNSEKQTAASRTNGGKSHGPTSAEGKYRSRLSALKNGLFSKDIVVAAAGERIEDYESFKTVVWDSVQPDGAVEEMLTDDLVTNWWRRQRVRRSESAELKSRLE